jgi:hypothetical protein
MGQWALNGNATGVGNTAIGHFALYSNTTGSTNTASGDRALSNNISGSDNTASGYQALANNTIGINNTASGQGALSFSVTGSYNTAIGYHALQGPTTGSNNIGIGWAAGINITGNNNIDIGNQGAAADNGVIRIGATGTHTSLFAAGVRGVTTGVADAIPVMIDSNGQLGTASSSRRFKTDVDDMGDFTRDLMRLRPVTFRYKEHASRRLEIGLIAEEVAEVYPDLVVRSPDGRIETIQYQKLAPMLLNEFQKQQSQLAAERERTNQLESRLAALESVLAKTARPNSEP